LRSGASINSVGADARAAFSGKRATRVPCRIAEAVGDLIVDEAIAIVVEAVANLGRRNGLADANAPRRAAAAGGRDTRLRACVANADAFCIYGTAITRSRHAVDDAIAIVIKAVARLRRGTDGTVALKGAICTYRKAWLADADVNAASLAYVHRVIVGEAITIVVHAVANLDGRDAELADAVFVDEAVAIVVEAVTNLGFRRLAWHIDLAGRSVLLGITNEHARSFANAFFAVVARLTFVGEIFVDEAITIVVEAIALFEDGRRCNNGRERVCQAVFVIREECRTCAACRRNGVELRRLRRQRRKADHVRINRHARHGRTKRGGCCDGITLAALRAIRQQNGRVFPARNGPIALDDRLQIIRRREQCARERRRPCAPKLAITAARKGAMITGQHACVKKALFAVEPHQRLLQRLSETNKKIRSSSRRSA